MDPAAMINEADDEWPFPEGLIGDIHMCAERARDSLDTIDLCKTTEGKEEFRNDYDGHIRDVYTLTRDLSSCLAAQQIQPREVRKAIYSAEMVEQLRKAQGARPPAIQKTLEAQNLELREIASSQATGEAFSVAKALRAGQVEIQGWFLNAIHTPDQVSEDSPITEVNLEHLQKNTGKGKEGIYGSAGTFASSDDKDMHHKSNGRDKTRDGPNPDERVFTDVNSNLGMNTKIEQMGSHEHPAKKRRLD